MSSRNVFAPASSLIAQLGAAGGAVSGWQAVLWIVRLLLNSEISASQERPWAALWAVLARIVSGDFQLRGCEVTHWTVWDGREHLECVRLNIRGTNAGLGKSEGFTLTIETVVTVNAEFLGFARLVPVLGRLFVAAHFEKFAKTALVAG